MKKSWHLDRRTFLRGAGASLALPFLECMGADARQAPRPKRFCTVYFPYGVSLPKPGSEFAQWNWQPKGEGTDYVFNESLKPLEPHRKELTVLSGLSHPNGRRMGGHDTADIFLTAVELKGGRLRNSISIDQLMARHHGDKTRFDSLAISTDGGVGEPTRSSTLSFGRNGQPIPAQNKPQLIFDRLFGVNPDSLTAQERELQRSKSMLDRVLEHSKSIRRGLGKYDQDKFDEYLASVRQIEKRVERSRQWLTIPKPKVDATGLSLEANDETPKELIQTMYDLLFLAFQTDSTRMATYQIGNMNGATSIAGKLPQLLGLPKNMHGLAHGAKKGQGAEHMGKWDQFLAQNFSYFIDRLKSTPEGEGNLLDHTILYYGSSNSNTHQNVNYPLIVAGGDKLGFKHGRHLKFNAATPLSNLYVTFLNRMDVPTESFVDSTGAIKDLLG